jgi:hypothetical protein
MCAVGFLALPASAGPWAYRAGGGLISGYDPNDDFYGSSDFTSTWLSFVSVHRAVNPTLWVRAEVSHFGYRGSSPRYSGYYFATPGTASAAAAAAAPADRRRATFVPVALGFRWQGVPGSSGIAPYLDFLPTLIVFHWNEDYSGSVYSPDTTIAFAGNETFTRGVFGITTGVGVHIVGNERWSLDYGIQWRFSAKPGRDWPPGPVTAYRSPMGGLRNVALAVGLSWRP